MSNYMAKARDRKTGKIVGVACFDDYFGRHVYGYEVDGRVMRAAEFLGEYEFWGEKDD